MKKVLFSLVLVSFAAVVVGCGGSAPPPKVEEAPHEDDSQASRAPLPQMQQELGSIDERAVQQTFVRLQDQAEICHQKGRDRIEYLTGDVKVFLRIDQQGKVRYGYFEESTLGDRETEKCILDVYLAGQWPRPIGGEAEVRYGFGWGPGGEREPTSWGPEKVMDALSTQKGVAKSVHKCRANAKGDLRITGYVVGEDEDVSEVSTDTSSSRAKHPKKAAKKSKEGNGGKFQSIGVAASTREASEKADCVVDALKSLVLPSPGSYAAKVSYTLQ